MATTRHERINAEQTAALAVLFHRHRLPDAADAVVEPDLNGVGAILVEIHVDGEVTTYRINSAGSIQIPNPDVTQDPRSGPDWIPEPSDERKGLVP